MLAWSFARFGLDKMVEKEATAVNVIITGILSKEEDIERAKKVTHYWDISGDMETAPDGGKQIHGNMKLPDSAKVTMVTERKESIPNNDSVSTDDNANSPSVELESVAMKNTYCDKKNSESAIEFRSTSNNANNNNANQAMPQNGGEVLPKNYEEVKNFVASDENIENNIEKSNIKRDQTEIDLLGTTVKEGCSNGSDTMSNKDNLSGVNKDNDMDNRNELRNSMLSDPECIEERFRVDRKKLEQMLQAAVEGRGQGGEEFFQNIMDDTNTHITWPSKLKIGAKSKKDPHIRICGKPDNVKLSRQRIMMSLDTKSNRVTIKMDVSHTEHSHVIGKGGNNIKRVMQETGCHIHFPDSNRNNTAEKSNQVSITGHPEGVEDARLKIRNLLPVVLMFEIPLTNAVLPMPDPNSPMIQHLVQLYGISIQFKQRYSTKYSTSCTVRGSSDNTEGLKSGIQTLMSHLAGGQLPVTTQIEIAPQHHSYMLSKSGTNVNTIIQSTGVRVIFPDPGALPKKSTVYVTGTIDSVLKARRKIMGCLPLLLMFDVKEDSNCMVMDTVTIARLVEKHDVFINVKPKPKQPSKTVIIKSMEYNIYNMFDARKQLLKLETNGLNRPPPSVSPNLPTASMAPTSVTMSPMILLAPSHVGASSGVPTRVIGITDPKTLNPLSCAVLNGPSYVITHSVASNNTTPRPLSALSATHTPSQSPFSTLAQAGGVMQDLGNRTHHRQDMIVRGPRSLSRNEDPGYIMPGSNLTSPQTVQLSQTPQHIVTSPQSYDPQSYSPTTGHIQQRSMDYEQHSVPRTEISQNMAQYKRDVAVMNWNAGQRNYPIRPEMNGHGVYPNLPHNRQQDERRPSNDSRVLVNQGSHYDSQIQKQFRSNSLPYQTSYGIQQIPSPYSPLLANKTDDYQDHDSHPLLENQYPDDVADRKEDMRNCFNIGGQINIVDGSPASRTPIHPSISSLHSSSSRNSLSSERNSPISMLSEPRYGDGPRLGIYDNQNRSIQQSPSPSTNVFHSLVNNDLSSLSPASGSSLPHHHTAPQIVLNQQGRNENNSSEANLGGDNEIQGMYPLGVNDISATGPPPGFEGFPAQPPNQKTDYESKRRMAEKAMENKPVTSEVRTPTDIWAGWGFSKSMPDAMVKKLQKLAASRGQFRNNLITTYENGDDNPQRSPPSPVHEEDEEGIDSNSNPRLQTSAQAASSSKGASSLSAWRLRNNMNLSLGGNVSLSDFVGGMQRRQQNHSAFTPIHANERSSRSPGSPKTSPIKDTMSRNTVSSPFNNSGNERTLHYARQEKHGVPDAGKTISGTPTIQDSLGLNVTAGSSKVVPDISDILLRLDLSKYSHVFQQQEVDFQTFLTLTDSDLKELGISMFGPRKKILMAIQDLNKNRDVFGTHSDIVSRQHENPSDHMLQLQRLQIQQQRDNPQTHDSHSLLSPSRGIFSSPSHHSPTRLEVPNAIDRGVFHDENPHPNIGPENRARNTGRFWQNSRSSISRSNRW